MGLWTRHSSKVPYTNFLGFMCIPVLLGFSLLHPSEGCISKEGSWRGALCGYVLGLSMGLKSGTGKEDSVNNIFFRLCICRKAVIENIVSSSVTKD